MTRRRILTGLLAILCSSIAFGQTVRTWVSASGSDANACSRTAPCRNFTAAINAVDPGGEVVVIDSAGYGPVTITKPVAIIAPAGVHAAIAPSSGNAITIPSGLAGPVVLRNLFLNSQGATTGVEHQSGSNLFVEDCEIHGFSQTGIHVLTTAGTGPAYLSVRGCAIHNGGWGIQLLGSFNVGEIDDTVAENLSQVGFEFLGASPGSLSLRNCVAANSNVGFKISGFGGSMDVTDSAAFHCETGFFALGSSGGVKMYLDRCLASSNTTGLAAGAFQTFGTRMTVANSVITNNATGVSLGFPESIIESRGDNTLENNAAGNTFPGSYSVK